MNEYSVEVLPAPVGPLATMKPAGGRRDPGPWSAWPRRAELLEGDQGLPRQDAEHDLLPERAREGRRAEVDGVVRGRERELAVLRYPALRDVHSGEDLDARDQLERDVGGDALLLDHLAVDAEADVQPISLRLEVDVARLGLHRAAYDLVEDEDGALLEEIVHRSGLYLAR